MRWNLGGLSAPRQRLLRLHTLSSYLCQATARSSPLHPEAPLPTSPPPPILIQFPMISIFPSFFSTHTHTHLSSFESASCRLKPGVSLNPALFSRKTRKNSRNCQEWVGTPVHARWTNNDARSSRRSAVLSKHRPATPQQSSAEEAEHPPSPPSPAPAEGSR